MAEQQQPQQPQGTEYTLQGVMRFLQVEWHNHERNRNAWEIERAELKAKIAKQEGDFRNSKRLNVILEKRVRMLETILKQEVVKRRRAGDVQPEYMSAEPYKAMNGGAEPPANDELRKKTLDHITDRFFSAEQAEEEEAKKMTAEEKELQRDKNKKFLQKCVEELTYILTPPKDPPGPSSSKQQEVDGQLNQLQQQPTAEQVYEQQQMFKRNQQAGASHLPSLPNHHPPPVRQPPEYINSQQQQQQTSQPGSLSRHPGQSPPNYPPPVPEPPQDQQSREMLNQQQPPQQPPRPQQDYNLYDRQVTTSTQELDPAAPLFGDDDDANWTFDDDPALPLQQPLAAGPPSSQSRNVNLFPSTNEQLPPKSPTRTGPHSHIRRRSSGSHGSQRMMRKTSNDGAHEVRETSSRGEARDFKVRFALRGHLDVIRSIIFTGGGSPSEPEICTASDDGTLKRWIIPANYGGFNPNNSTNSSHPQSQTPVDLDIQSYFTHRGHEGIVTSLAACPASPSLSTGGRALGDGWVFSGGQDATVRVWERGRVDPKATLDGHTDAIWALCVLPAPAANILGPDASSLMNSTSPTDNRILLASGSADCSIRIWAVTAPPQLSAPQAASAAGAQRRGVGGTRRHSITSGSNFPSSPQPSTASVTPFHSTLVHVIALPHAQGIPTCITPLGNYGESFVASYTDASVLIFDTRTGEQVVGMASGETYDGTPATAVNAVCVSSARVAEIGGKEEIEGAPTGSNEEGSVEGVVVTGHEDRFVRFFDANSGQCTYSMLAHPSSIASLSLSPDGHELVTAGHDASIRFWDLEKRACIQEVATSHRLFRGEGVVSVVWSSDGRWVVSGGGDGVVKVFGRDGR